ncbi:MAG: siderophore ABC transporter substrate-binding protein [Intrasporangium sp.]|uniref:siderophore ABC transporter substrate-binding protein n=1 Tax=Intrasporangium sp. TaxID=1925024 RepID=UPI002647889D|nr:siderophore ABC transporter substrate-binding protein [Intrasporangium sp.]MDN5797796.1 siderophore ABC transporter substrate-binding protein [Intrasporangium sp.]
MSRKPLVVAALACAALPLAACGTADSPSASSGGKPSVTVTHAQGTTSLPAAPDRVVVLDLAVLDTLDSLGLGNTVVGLPKGNLPDFQSGFKADTYAAVGTFFEPDVEKIAELDPDVILIGGRSAKAYPELAKIAPTVDLTMSGPDALKDVRNQSEQIGEIFGKQQAVADKLADLESKVADVKAKAANAAPALVLMTSGGKVSAFGAGSRFGLIHDSLGVPTAVPDLKQDAHGQAVSFEFIAKKDPAQLFVIDRDAAIGQQGTPAAKVLDNPLVTGTAAWQDGKVTYLDGARWYILGGGLGNTAQMVDAVGAALTT